MILVDSLIETCLTRWLDLFNQNLYKQKHRGWTWLRRAQTLQIWWDSVHILTHALNNLITVDVDIKITNAISKRIILTKFWYLNMLPKNAKTSKKNHFRKKGACFLPVKKYQSSCFQMILRKVILRNYNLLKVNW